MCMYFELLGFAIPTYGLMIAVGLLLANCIAIFVLKKFGLDFNNLMILEGYGLLGAFLGAKGLYFIVSFREIEWHRILDLEYLNEFMKTGFVFYGGLILGVVFILIAGKIHNIDSIHYVNTFVFLIPFMHAFGRLGCFCAGCCYGIPYEGIGAVVFPIESCAIPNVKMFPVQLVEMFLLLLLSVVLAYLQFRKSCKYILEIYLLLYGMLRFILEYLRYDTARGNFLMFSTSQWISFFMILLSIQVIRCKKIRKCLE